MINRRNSEHYGDVLFQLENKDGALLFWEKRRKPGSILPINSKLMRISLLNKLIYGFILCVSCSSLKNDPVRISRY